MAGRTSHAAIVSRELGLPALVGTGDATQTLHDEQEVTVSCAEGDEGFVYEGIGEYDVETLSLDDIPETRTKIMLNVGNPSAAFRWWAPAGGGRRPRTHGIRHQQLDQGPSGRPYPLRQAGR